ncbi:FecR family protein [Aestuariivivens sp. NBU2969]|uniref:FecR family protein n=1 Tax=Aestuariivivens sp. NBU2969 TaxID=2873267 RepID=UPI001CC06DF4|nr:FecR family protein [Aestuariivivens sp. NBU2969]
MNSNIEQFIIKFLTKEANLEELLQLELWINNPENETLFLEYIKTNTYANRVLKTYNKEQAKKIIAKRIKQEKRKTKSYNILKYAAVIIFGLLTTGYLYKNKWFNQDTPNTIPTVVNTNAILPGSDKATLTLEDGSIVILEKGKTMQTQNASSNGEQIVYTTQKNKDAKPKEIAYNYLNIPRGGQYHLVLSDGTAVWLNSESLLKYPVTFAEGLPREVELVYGEAYFDVSPSIEHNGSTFNVINQGQNIEVLGTQFNIKAYQDETIIYTTLVEGEVIISYNEKKRILAPNQQSSIDINNQTIDIYPIDVNTEISWRKGLFTFKGKPLKNIMKVLSRWYDVDVIFLNKDLESLKFKGVLGKDQNIEEVLAIMKTNTINDYEIKGKTIVLK